MQPVHLFNLAFRQAEWLAVRQATIAENVANANTPGYRARDVEPFEATFDRTALAMRATDPRHVSFEVPSERAGVVERPRSWDIVGKGNDVKLEQELIKSGEVARDYSLNVGIMKSFHRMWLASAKG